MTRDDLLSGTIALILALSDCPTSKIRNVSARDNNAKGPQMAQPFLTVRLLTPGGGQHGPAESLDGVDGGGDPTEVMREIREATVSIQGYGSTAFDWMDQVQSELGTVDALELAQTLGTSFELLTAVTDLSALLDTDTRQRGSLELRLRHQHRSRTKTRIPFERAEVDMTIGRYPGDPDTLDASFALDESGELAP